MVLIRHPDGDWTRSSSSEYTNEAELQQLLAESPELLPGLEGPVAAAIEMTIPGSGRADIVLVTATGQIAIVECKLRANPEIRREAVGQLLAYVSAVWGMRFEEFRALFSSAAGADLLDLVEEAASSGGLEWDADGFRRSVDLTLSSGAMTMIMAVDEITDEMKRTILYLNDRTGDQASVFAFEARVVRADGLEILVPRTYGEESAAESRTTQAAHHQWDEESLFAHLSDACSPEAVAAFRDLYEVESQRCSDRYFGSGRKASVTFWYDVSTGETAVWSCYASGSGASFDINFDWMRARGVTPGAMGALAAGLRKLPGFSKRLGGVEDAEFRKRPSFPIQDVLVPQGSVAAISNLIKSLVDA